MFAAKLLSIRFLRPLMASLLLLTISIAGANFTHANEMEVDVELVLAVDVSRSMSPDELEIQRRGYAEALVSKDVIRAIQSGLIGKVAITYVEWAGTFSQRTIVDWTAISNLEEAQAFANKLTAHFDDGLRRTSISGALDYTSTLFEQNGFISNRMIIDVSGDGPNNQGRPVLPARADTLAKGIVINGLPLMTRDGAGGFFSLDDLDEYYRQCVIGGPGAFVIPVLSWEQFPKAVRQKLVLELAYREETDKENISPEKINDTDYDCLIGEKMWEIFRQQRLFFP
ncbi:MAG: DUF1194 domain-containing protein [Pseudomonadota bacterium]